MTRATFVGGPIDGKVQHFDGDPPAEICAPESTRPRFVDYDGKPHEPSFGYVTYIRHRYERPNGHLAPIRLTVYLPAGADPHDPGIIAAIRRRAYCL